jgi:predicted Zn-dependent peptidase
MNYSIALALTRLRHVPLAGMLWLSPGLANANLDLSQASVDILDNGLTVIVLEEHSFPVVSVQMLYRTGARDESVGKTGLSHFVEHMVFLQSKKFPDFGLVSTIETVGGEMHALTWLDQTTFFATVPARDLELLIRIEADRMTNAKWDTAGVESERSGILTELYGYENDPASVLHDNVLYLTFLAHPYRNNTIGWDSDVLHITHQELQAFYAAQYHPGNAVLAVVGDVSRAETLQLIKREFDRLPGRVRMPKPHTLEPVQDGVRRIRILGAPERKFVELAYRAPSVHSPDFAAFLLIQDLLAGSSGINFLENDWGTPARPDSILAGVSDDLTTWFPPQDQDYAFTIRSTLAEDGDEGQLENAIEAGIQRLRRQFTGDPQFADSALEQAVRRVRRALVLDNNTTEDAAFMLAWFAGLDALTKLIGLPELLQKVTAGDVVRVLDTWLRPEQRTIGWFVPGISGHALALPDADPDEQVNDRKSSGEPAAHGPERAGPALATQLSNGTPVIVQRSTLSPTATLKVVVAAADLTLPHGVDLQEPAPGLMSLDFRLLPNELGQAIRQARDIIDSAAPISDEGRINRANPDALLEQSFRQTLNLPTGNTPAAGPVLLVVTGDIDPDLTGRMLEDSFADLPANPWAIPAAKDPPAPGVLEKQTGFPVAQEALGYLSQVPNPSVNTAVIWQMVLTALMNVHQDRLWMGAIPEGLVYYIETAFHTDGRNQWITLKTGVDQGKHEAMKKLLVEQLALLVTEPPSHREIDEARAYMLGRNVSEAQSNAELADSLTWQWILFGKLLDYQEYERLLNQVSREDIIEQLPAFSRGVVVSVRNPLPEQAAIK